jgi:hypothetical protein
MPNMAIKRTVEKLLFCRPMSLNVTFPETGHEDR